MAGLAFGQSASFSFDDNSGTATSGTYNPNDTFTLSLFGTASGFTADGFSLWLEVPTTNEFNTTINITSATYIQFTDSIQPNYPKVFNDPSGARPGYVSDHDTGAPSGDLGAVSDDPSQQFTGTMLLANYTFSLAGAPAGTYTLYSTEISPKGSEINDTSFVSHNAPAASYTITVVPEPSTWSMLILGGLGTVGLVALRRRRRA